MSKKHDIVIKGYHYNQDVYDKYTQNEIFYLALNFSSYCNYKCPYCFVGLYDLNKKGIDLSLNKMKDLLGEAKELGAKTLTIPGQGEPFLDKKFWDITEYAALLGYWIVIYTNGYYLDTETINRIKNLPISLFLKTDSFNSSIYDEMVGVKDTYSMFRKNLETLLVDFHKPEVIDNRIVSRLGMNSVVTKQSADSIEELYNFCQKHSIYYTCRSPVKVGQADKTWEYLVGSDIEKLQAIGKKYASRNFTSATPKGQCGIYRFGLTIENNGDIYVCPNARENFEPIGNVNDNSLSELIENRNRKYPLNSESGYCFAKSHRNPEVIQNETSLPLL
jgi:MoaA/NifB/PqqE/SkfB family radical SAM enzyme